MLNKITLALVLLAMLLSEATEAEQGSGPSGLGARFASEFARAGAR